MVGEYAGEVLRTPLAQERMKTYDKEGLNYLLCLREHVYVLIRLSGWCGVVADVGVIVGVGEC